MDSNIHKGHRSRLKDRFLAEGLDNFELHNVLELLLFYAIPRVDTNEIAHNLINTFGSISEVFDAPYEELCKVASVSKNAATLIKLVPNLAKTYITNKHSDQRFFDSTDKIGEYFVDKYIGCTAEVVYLMLLDSSLQLICCDILSKGSVNSSSINMRMIIDRVVKHNACSVVLAHNHPRGLPLPSQEDMSITFKIVSALKALEIRFIDHIIVAQSDYLSLVEGGYVSILG